MRHGENRRSLMARIAGMVLMVLLLGMAAPVHAGFFGQSVDADYRYPAIGTVFDGMSTQIVGAGVEFSLFGVAIDLDDTHISFARPGPFFFQPGTFNGWSFFDVFGTIDAIVGVDIVSTNVGLTNSRVTFDADHIFVNFVDLATTESFETTLIVTFQRPGGVPEPSTLALLGLALGLIGFRHRSRAARGA